MTDITSMDETLKSFNQEAELLVNMMENIQEKTNEIGVSEIVQVYYQIINVSSMIKVLKPQFEGEKYKVELENIEKFEKLIKEKFDQKIHVGISKYLSKLIETSMTELKLMKKSKHNKSKEDIEEEAKLFENLRGLMSTKEFVQQYNEELNHD